MQFEQPLIEAKFLKRYKRFFADVVIDGKVVQAHVANTGSLKSCNIPDIPCLVSPATNPERKLRYSLEMLKTPTSWVGINTSIPNRLVRELFESKKNKDWSAFDRWQWEVKINPQTRLDMAFWNDKKQPAYKDKITKLAPPLHLIEVKNVTLAEDGVAQFPDAVTERGQKHILELMKLMDEGFTCELVFVVQREDCKTFAPADDIDPEYGKLLRKAHKKGLIISPFVCSLSPKGITLNAKKLDVDL